MEDVLGGQMGASSSFYDYAKDDLTASRVSASSQSYRSMLSPAASPTNIQNRTPPRSAPTIFEQIAEWFRAMISRRKVVAASVAATCTFPALFAVSSLAHFSLWSPFESVVDSLFSVLSAYAWTVGIFVWFSFFSLFCLANYSFYKPNVARRASMSSPEAWSVAAFAALTHLIFVYAVLCVADTELHGAAAVLMLLCSVCSGWFTAFRLDYRLTFSTMNTNPWSAMLECLSLTGESPLVLSLYDTLYVYRVALVLHVVTGFVWVGAWSTVQSLFSPFLHLIALTLTLTFILLARLAIRATREFVMRPLVFPLPPAHAVRSPTPAQTRTLLNVLDTEDETLRGVEGRPIARRDARLQQFDANERRPPIVATRIVQPMERTVDPSTLSPAAAASPGPSCSASSSDALPCPGRRKQLFPPHSTAAVEDGTAQLDAQQRHQTTQHVHNTPQQQ